MDREWLLTLLMLALGFYSYQVVTHEDEVGKLNQKLETCAEELAIRDMMLEDLEREIEYISNYKEDV